jgi:RNA polymerase sigma factor (sigma-70 family)
MAPTLCATDRARGADSDAGNVACLFKLARDGDEAATHGLLSRVQPLVARAARRYVRCPSDVEDVVQDTWLALVTGWDAIRSPEALCGWLWRVATNSAIRRGRARSYAPLPDDAGESGGELFDEASERVLRNERRHTVRAAIGRLGSSDRELLETLAQDDRPNYQRVSEVLGRPVGSIGPSRMRALARLGRDPDIAALY